MKHENPAKNMAGFFFDRGVPFPICESAYGSNQNLTCSAINIDKAFPGGR